MFAVRFDPTSLQLAGNPTPVLEGVYGSNFSFVDSGTLTYISGGPATNLSTLTWLDLEGQVTTLIEDQRDYRWASLSPELDRVAVLIFDESGTSNIWIYDIDSGTPGQLTNDTRSKGPVTWTPDGQRLTFEMDSDIYWQAIDGAEPAELLWDHESPVTGLRWSPDGRFLVFGTLAESGPDLWVLSVEEDAATGLVNTDAVEVGGQFSPNGKWISFVQIDEQGNNSVMVVPYPGPGVASEVSVVGRGPGGFHASAADGRTLYYRGAGASFRKVMSVPVEVEPVFRRGEEKTLFEFPGSFNLRDFDPVGERFLNLDRVDDNESSNRINVVLNWFEELKEKVPVP